MPPLSAQTYRDDPGSHALKPQGVGPDEPNCYGVVARVDLTIGGSGRAFRSPVRHKVCPTPQW